MTANDLQALLPSLEMFHRRFGRFFVRSEARAWSHKYLIGLTLPIERKNVENIAEQVGAPPRKLQEFLSDSPWDEEGCIEELQGFVGEQMGSADGVLILDDTGFAKKGIWSAGVARQYSGTLGRVDNCQVGVFLPVPLQGLRHLGVTTAIAALGRKPMPPPTRRRHPASSVCRTPARHQTWHQPSSSWVAAR